nr:copia protein [Tanacetum cinerariifolium]
MLTFANLPLFLWAEAIAIACFTQNRSFIHKRFDKTPYELINIRKPNIKFFHVFGCRYYLLNDYGDVGKLKAKGDIEVFVGYLKDSAGFVSKQYPDHVYSLDKALYGLKQAPQAWYAILSKFLIDSGFQKAVKRIFRYLKGTINLGLWYPKDFGFDLTAYSDADHSGCHLDRKTESEYVAVSECCDQVLWMRTQLTDYGFSVTGYRFTMIQRVLLQSRAIRYNRTKHIDVRYHFVKDHVEKGTIELYFVGTEYQLANLFTKSLSEARFKFLVEKLGMMSRET